MTFEFSAEHEAVRAQARAVAQALRSRAGEIDRTATLPDDVRREVAAIGAGDALARVVAIETVAAASGAAALAVGRSTASDGGPDLTGLRGAPAVEGGAAGQLTLAAVALGLGQCALDAAIEVLRTAKADETATEKPHWVLADAATDLEAGRLLTYKAAGTLAEADVAVARLMASAAAERAVSAALRIAGPDALKEGAVLERLARDVRAAALLSGTEEDQRTLAASGLLPG